MCKKILLFVFYAFSLLMVISCEKDSADNKAGGYEFVDLGLSVKWATCNIGAANPWEAGRHFAWGDVEGQIWNGTFWSGEGFYTCPSYELDANKNLKPEYDAAHVNLGGSWRMPTDDEFDELINNSTSIWVCDYNGTGVAGRIFISNKEGYTGKSIFLPAAGFGTLSYHEDVNSYGFYWSSTFSGDDYARGSSFNSDHVNPCRSNYRGGGVSIRPVSE